MPQFIIAFISIYPYDNETIYHKSWQCIDLIPSLVLEISEFPFWSQY
jgi:hypothetical protein